MKCFNIFLVFFILIIGCKQAPQSDKIAQSTAVDQERITVGKDFDPADASSATEMKQRYAGLKVADTLTTSFSARVLEVCQAKGCWMKLQLADGQQTMVRFKDYGFFVPKDIAGKQVVVNGLAFVEEMSIEDQRHYAKDAGKTEAELANIDTVKKTNGFEADGVIILN